MKRAPLLVAGAAALALAYLVAMVIAGALPQQKQLVKFEARGLMKPAPESIDRVTIEVGSRSAALKRQGEGWNVEGGVPVPADLARRVSMAVQFMNTSGPLRTMDAPELTGSNLRDFGLDPPRLRATLYRGNEPVIAPVFGARNPDDTAQYMSLAGKPDIYLMSRFVGQEWEAVALGIGLARPPSAAPSGR
ncbi:MAG TPA: hypothetical protein VHA15_00190 [Burkholderiales bacterium]|nr:hypothetical protein [Burkholderiales bacterium]